MSMGIGINAQEADAGEVKGYQEAVACSVWFTSTGTVIPKMIKYKDTQREIHSISNIHISSFEKKNYCGIPTLEYLCSTTIGAKCYEFHLLFYVEKQEWKLLWKNRRKEATVCAGDII